MGRILAISRWTENIFTSRAACRSLFLLIGGVLLAGCGSAGRDDFACQGLGGNTVSGTVRYQKKLYDQNGFTGKSIFLPARFATVQVFGPKQSELATATTDGQGRYCAIYVKTGEPTENRVSVVARTNVPTLNIQVGFFFGVQLPDESVVFRFTQYAFSKPFQEIAGESAYTVDLELGAGRPGSGSSPGGVLNIMDTLVTGSDFFRTVRGEVPPLVTAVWQDEIGGTFFIPEEQCVEAGTGVSGDCIFVRGDGDLIFGESFGDRDEYDDDIILHEYGHFIGHNFSADTSPGGTHFLNDHTQDIRLSWSEGWATFFSSVVRKNPVNVDVGVDGPALFAFSIDSNSLLFPPIAPGQLERSVIYTTSEVAVSSVLWDIFDSLDSMEPFDNLSLGFGPIWDIFSFWKESPPQPDTTMETFWSEFGQVQPEFIPQKLSITRERQMEFFSDACELSSACSDSMINKVDDNSAENASPIGVNGTPQHHTLFPAGDTDYMSFQPEEGNSYTIETLNLTNGADTYLEVLYLSVKEDVETQTVRVVETALHVNDNPGDRTFTEGCAQLREGPDGNLTSDCPNNKSALASKVVITNFITPSDCPVPCTLYARVKRSPNAPPSTGVFGSYDFRVTSP